LSVRRLAAGLYGVLSDGKWVFGMLVFCLGPVAIAQSTARDYPDQPLRFIVPFPAGGGTDFLARTIGDKLALALGQSVVIENHPGAAGNIGAELAAKAPPNGYTLFFGSAGPLTINPNIYAHLGFDPVRSFVPVTRLVDVPSAIVAGPSMPASTLTALIALAREEPGKIAYATSGVGTSSHMAMVQLSERAGIQLLHVPYGASGVLRDVLSGEVPLAVAAVEVVKANVDAGKLRALAVTSRSRITALPETPTVAESAIPGFVATSWYGVLVPAGTPDEIVQRLYVEITRILRDPNVRQRLVTAGQEPVGNTPEQFSAEIKSELAQWARTVKTSGLHID
jgi:tripartite-type tricarboxylate transporter receptor subunit TctC